MSGIARKLMGTTALEVGYNLAGASYDGVSFSVASQETQPLGLAFNSDGTKMYVVGESTDAIYQYSLSTAFDLSTASYDSVSFSVAGQDGGPGDIIFSSDGTKMYIVGTSTDAIYQYSLSTAFDLSTASYDSVSFSVAGQESALKSAAFSSDGTKMYIVGTSTDAIYQYSLSTAFDLSTASYDFAELGVGPQESFPVGLVISNDGTKIFILGDTNDSVFQYSLSTAFDLSTASYDSVSFSLGSQTVEPRGIAFNSDGTKMYVIEDTANDFIYQYTTK